MRAVLVAAALVLAACSSQQPMAENDSASAQNDNIDDAANTVEASTLDSDDAEEVALRERGCSYHAEDKTGLDRDGKPCAEAPPTPPKLDAPTLEVIRTMRAAEAGCPEGAEGEVYANNERCREFDRLSTVLEQAGYCMIRDRLYRNCDTNDPVMKGDEFL